MFTAVRKEMLGVTEAVAKLRLDEREKMRLVLDAIGKRTVAYLRSYTSKTRPPIRPGGQPRPAHPGEWADRSGHLAASYDSHVEPTVNGWALVLENSAEYAVQLEAMAGFFVLSGVTDRGGPVERLLRDVIAELAPGWQVTTA